MRANTDQDTQLLVELRRRRAELRASMGALERALASPTGAGLSASWGERFLGALRALQADFTDHVSITEGPDGLYAELAQESPRLAHRIERLTEEHAEIARQLEQLLGAEGEGVAADVTQARQAGTDLLVSLMHHRQRGADLVFEAYEVDMGGET